jgi:hypothetical protein
MPEELRWNMSIQIVGGPSIAAKGIIQADVYSKMQVVVPAQSSGGNLQVSLDTSSLTLIFITASQYVNPDNPAQVLQYDTGGGAVNLTAPLMLLGATGVGLLGASVSNITFTNPIDEEITVDIVVAGDATP